MILQYSYNQTFCSLTSRWDVNHRLFSLCWVVHRCQSTSSKCILMCTTIKHFNDFILFTSNTQIWLFWSKFNFEFTARYTKYLIIFSSIDNSQQKTKCKTILEMIMYDLMHDAQLLPLLLPDSVNSRDRCSPYQRKSKHPWDKDFL